jgi:hypothetical protein
MPARTPDQAQARADCLDAAATAHDTRAAEECPLSEDWDTCPARPELMADLAAAQKACR